MCSSDLPPPARSRSNRSTAHIESTAKQDNETAYYAADAIRTAIQGKRQIRFQYIEYTAEKEKVLKHNGYRYEFSPMP